MKIVTMSFLAATLIAAASTASAGPIVCAGSAAAAATGWAVYGIVKILTAPVTIWSTPAEVGVLVAAGTATIEFVGAACVLPTP